MGFEKGHLKLGGRKPGAKNKRNKEFLAVLETKKFCPASALIQCYEDARHQFETAIQSGFISDDNTRYLKIAADTAKELASYAYPKLKSIEQQRVNPLEGMSLQQKLEAMKNAVALLEMEIQNGG